MIDPIEEHFTQIDSNKKNLIRAAILAAVFLAGISVGHILWNSPADTVFDRVEVSEEAHTSLDSDELDSDEPIDAIDKPIDGQSNYGKWHSILTEEPLLTFKNDFGLTARAYAIRDITGGQFAGQLLSLIYYREDENRQGYINLPKLFHHTFYVSDKNGAPVAAVDILGESNGGYVSLDPHSATPFFPGWKSKSRLVASDLPKELRHIALADKFLDSNGNELHLGSGMFAPDESQSVTPVGVFLGTMPIVKILDTNPGRSKLEKFNYFIQLPFGALFSVEPEPLFASWYDPMYGTGTVGDVLPLVWNSGSKTVEGYSRLLGIGDVFCFRSTNISQIESSLISTGEVLLNGDPLYELDPVLYGEVYECMYENVVHHAEMTINSRLLSYSNFTKSHPFFFWRHPYGELMLFTQWGTGEPSGAGKGP